MTSITTPLLNPEVEEKNKGGKEAVRKGEQSEAGNEERMQGGNEERRKKGKGGKGGK